MMKKFNNTYIYFYLIMLFMFIGAMGRIPCLICVIPIFAFSLLIAIKNKNEKTYIIPFMLMVLLAFQNFIVGIGAHLTENYDYSIRLMTQVPFIVTFVIWAYNFLISKNKISSNILFIIYLFTLFLSFVIGRGKLFSMIVTLRNLTAFYMYYQIGKVYLKEKKQVDIFVKYILKLSIIMLICGIILLICGFSLYSKIGYVEIYNSKIGSILTQLDGRFYTSLISKQFIRMGSLFYEPVNLAYFYACTFLLSLFYDTENKYLNIFVNGLGLILTFGKGGYLLSAVVIMYIVVTKLVSKYTKIEIKKCSNYVIIFVILTMALFSIFYFLFIGAAAVPHFVGVINTFKSILVRPFGYGLGTGGNMANLFGSDTDWLSSGGETAFMSFFYQIGIQGIICLILVFWSLSVKKLNNKVLSIELSLMFKILPFALLAISVLQDNTFTPQCIVLFMILQGAIKRIVDTDSIGDD